MVGTWRRESEDDSLECVICGTVVAFAPARDMRPAPSQSKAES